MPVRLLVLTPYETIDRFQRCGPGLVLSWGLERRGIDWELHQPWHERPDIGAFDAVLSWPYGLLENHFFLRCKEFERSCSEFGVPLVNSLREFNVRHSHSFALWKRAGIPCPDYQHIVDADEIALDFPVILRTDGIHRGRNMHLAESREQAARIMEESFWTTRYPPIDLAVRFVDTRSDDGYFRKRRCHVIGDRLVPRQQTVAEDWKVNLTGATAIAHEEDRRFIEEGERAADLVRRAGRSLGSDMVALDYCVLPDGSYVFWEGNRNYALSVGGRMLEQFSASTGRTLAECHESLLRIGDALAELVVERAAARS